jgi:hypothetical protein
MLSSWSWRSPAPDIQKQCFYRLRKGVTEGWKPCAAEGEMCNAPGGAMIAYGIPVDGRYTMPVKMSKPVRCGKVTFGIDPAPGVVKSCWHYYPPQ